MTDEEFATQAMQHARAMQRAQSALVDFARSLVMTLQDAQRGATAKELERLIFAVDVADQEGKALVEKHNEKMVSRLLDALKPPGRPDL